MFFNLYKNEFELQNIDKNKLAFIGSDGEVTWEKFEEIVALLILNINSLELPKGYPVFIYGHKQVLFPASIIACLTTEHPFIPIDELYPEERIHEIMEETGTNVLIDCSSSYKNPDIITLSFKAKQIEILNNNILSTKSNTPVYNKNPLAYILFTSGSTGKPKGVLIRKQSVLSLIDWIQSKAFEMSKTDVFVNQAPFSFDVSLFDTFATLSYGATMIMVSKELASKPNIFKETLSKYKATFWTSTPSFIYIYQREEWFNDKVLPHLKKFLFAGELLVPTIVKKVHLQFSSSKVWNAFGPTEATVITTLLEIDENIINSYPILPIGYSKPQSKMITLPNDANKDNLGELVIVGENVAEGYLNRPNQTSNQFYIHKNKKAYKTGDLGYIKDGLIFCLGRNDDQIKFNGYRIELEEINKKIISFGNIDEVKTVGLVRNNKVTKIVAMYQAIEKINPSELKGYLSEKLPYYMIPSDFLKINQFPMNDSGKINRNKLQEFYITTKKNTPK
jgi:D-alanine--poly(phosphoribitol) ligase subunit 1